MDWVIGVECGEIVSFDWFDYVIKDDFVCDFCIVVYCLVIIGIDLEWCKY